MEFNIPLVPNLNVTFLVGRIFRDPEYYGDSHGVVNFTISTEETVERDDGSTWQKRQWHSVKAFGDLARAAFDSDRFKQGANVAVWGKNVSESWEKKNAKGQPLKKNGKVQKGYRYRVEGIDLMMAHRENGALVWESILPPSVDQLTEAAQAYDLASQAGEAGVATVDSEQAAEVAF